MKCPGCDSELRIVDRHGIEIDVCPKCRGVWLDRGELEKILEKMQAEESATGPRPPRPASPPAAPPPPSAYAPSPGYAPPGYGYEAPRYKRDDDDDDDDDRYEKDRRRYEEEMRRRYGQVPPPPPAYYGKRKKSLWTELFDFD